MNKLVLIAALAPALLLLAACVDAPQGRVEPAPPRPAPMHMPAPPPPPLDQVMNPPKG